jgi:hypothetical protein
MTRFSRNIRPHVRAQLIAATEAQRTGRPADAFAHLEWAHVLGQASTALHVLVHWRMFVWGLRNRSARECAGQVLRMVGAATKTAIGWIPYGNTGGANVSPFKPMPVAAELEALIVQARTAGS